MNIVRIGLETVIANLILKDEHEKGIDISDINKFIDFVAYNLTDKFICCDISSYHIEFVLRLHKNIFKRYQTRIYRKNKFDLNCFNKDYSNELIQLFSKYSFK